MKRIATLVVLLLALVTAETQGAVLGGWDLTRGGPYSLSDGSYTTTVRTALTSIFPGTTITGSSTLTPAYLSTLDLLVITAAYTDSQPVTPLSAAEQTALVNFVQAGGRALLLGERNDLGPLFNASMMNPFGLNISGATFADPNATIVQTAPFTAGPFGTVSTITTTNPGWFDNVGSAITVATLDSNSAPVLAYFPENALGAGSGRVVFSADSDIYQENLTLILNTFSYLTVPEPSTLMLGLFGSLAVAWTAARRRRVVRR